MKETETSLLSDLLEKRDAPSRKRFFGGLRLPFQAAKFLASTPSLWGWAILPALINITLFAVVAIGLLLNAGRILDWLWSRPDVGVWYEWLFVGIWYLLFVVLLGGSVFIAYYAVLLIAGAIASPFNDKLSRETEELLCGDLVDNREDESELYGIARSIFVSVATTVLYLMCLAGLLFLHLIPGFGSLVYTALAACLSAIFLSIEYTDELLDRRGLGFVEKLKLLNSHRDAAAGFGAGTSLLLLIPLVNLLAMPIAVIAGTVLGLAVAQWDE